MNELERVVAVDHPDPHTFLGIHKVGTDVVVRAYRPDATRVRVLPAGVEAKKIHPAGIFEAVFPNTNEVFAYELECTYGDKVFTHQDAYAFLPTLGDIDVHLAAEGKHYKLWQRFGAHTRRLGGGWPQAVSM